MMNFGKSRARLSTDRDKQVVFANVAGLKEEKEDLEEVVDFLKNPQKYIRGGSEDSQGRTAGGPLPEPEKPCWPKRWPGKPVCRSFLFPDQILWKCLWGVGASRVRDLFEEAKRSAPCIIFIDEIDAVARMRGTGMGGGHDEREQTLNQLLVEMDGFGVNEGIIVMAATNRVDILDPAIPAARAF